MGSVDEWNAKMVAEQHAMKLRRIAAKRQEWTDKRDAAIVDAHEAGMSLRDIAEAVGVSHMTVDKIVKRQAS